MSPGWALTLSLAVATQPGPSSRSDTALLSELAAKVTAIIGTAAPAPTISTHCSSNLRERVCTAEFGTGPARKVVIVTRPHEQAVPGAPPAVPVVLQLRPLISQDEPILDAALLGQRLLVLDPAAVTMYETAADGWRRVSSYPLPATGPWPRDVRGRLRVSGGTWEAFLPGAWCHGPLEPLSATCTREQRAWPLGMENSGITAGRNAFTTADGLQYFSVAPLDSDAGARWMVATDEGKLVLLDEKQTPIQTAGGDGGDVAAISSRCADGSHVVVAGRAAMETMDALRVVRVVGRQLTDLAPPVSLAGRVTALWTAPAGDVALVVARNPTARGYEAFEIGIACGH